MLSLLISTMIICNMLLSFLLAAELHMLRRALKYIIESSENSPITAEWHPYARTPDKDI